MTTRLRTITDFQPRQAQLSQEWLEQVGTAFAYAKCSLDIVPFQQKYLEWQTQEGALRESLKNAIGIDSLLALNIEWVKEHGPLLCGVLQVREATLYAVKVRPWVDGRYGWDSPSKVEKDYPGIGEFWVDKDTFETEQFIMSQFAQ